MAVDPALLADAIEAFLNEPDDLEIWWCLEHHMAALKGSQSYCASAHYWPEGYPEPCRMVPASVWLADSYF